MYMPYHVTYNNYNSRNLPQQNFPGQTLSNAVLGASIAPLLGISPFLGLGLGALLLGDRGSNTNIININTGRNNNWDDCYNSFDDNF
jgi:hypothetical protein